MPAVFRRADQEENVGQHARTGEGNAGAGPAEGQERLGQNFAIGRRGCNRATPLSKAVVCRSSRALTASAISLVSHSQPVRAANSTIESITELRVRATSGTAMASGGSRSATRISSLAGAARRKHGLDLEQLGFVRRPDPPLQPMVYVGLGKSPLAADFPPRQLSALHQPDYLFGSQMEITCQAGNVKIAVGHSRYSGPPPSVCPDHCRIGQLRRGNRP